ncbi:hypothetical protein OUZ56_013937 [Daphnia magna]|uniref:Uncharacterized protein n=1 Tax=Daphnia magna TaxID=35525 RepID=A0ABQ9Z7E1_9CRUS|nr:hypothetical protein OUZ56_013937 [Daphnia magna]
MAKVASSPRPDTQRPFVFSLVSLDSQVDIVRFSFLHVNVSYSIVACSPSTIHGYIASSPAAQESPRELPQRLQMMGYKAKKKRLPCQRCSST